MTRFTKLFLIIVVLCASCNAQVDMNEFDLNKSEFVMLNNTELDANQTKTLEKALNKLKKRKKKIYSKPAHQITFKINGDIRYISIFEKENFVYNGYFLEAWTDRMEGKKSNGFKLSNYLKDLLKELKSKTEPLPSAEREDRAPAEAGRWADEKADSKGGYMDSIEQAKRIYEVCVLNAKAGKTVTYSEVLTFLGYKKGIPGHAIRYGLELSWIGCSHYKLPILTSIVVYDATGEPSPSGFSVSDWKKHAQEVFEHKYWPPVDEIDWDYIWKNRRELSNKYGTRGYWGG